MNLPEFQRRFNHKAGSKYIKNLYFVYLLEMRAFAKAAPYLRSQSYFTGDDAEDETVKTWTEKFLKVFNHFLRKLTPTLSGFFT